MKDTGKSEVSRVKHVGKKSSSKKNVCWLSNQISGETKEIDFGKEIALKPGIMLIKAKSHLKKEPKYS